MQRKTPALLFLFLAIAIVVHCDDDEDYFFEDQEEKLGCWNEMVEEDTQDIEGDLDEQFPPFPFPPPSSPRPTGPFPPKPTKIGPCPPKPTPTGPKPSKPPRPPPPSPSPSIPFPLFPMLVESSNEEDEQVEKIEDGDQPAVEEIDAILNFDNKREIDTHSESDELQKDTLEEDPSSKIYQSQVKRRRILSLKLAGLLQKLHREKREDYNENKSNNKNSNNKNSSSRSRDTDNNNNKAKKLTFYK